MGRRAAPGLTGRRASPTGREGCLTCGRTVGAALPAAVVTAMMPDGEATYAQHMDPYPYGPYPYDLYAYPYSYAYPYRESARSAAVLAVTTHIVLVRWARRRGCDPYTGWRSRLSVLCVLIAGLMVVLSAGVTVMTHADAAETAANLGRPMCEG
ncbi:hypothetical protein [Streptomyces sp. MST-110588]|uniref:hypothetical protein n=1 Tax=Streptomyces sp. MST-110588 TaxID=2833628 RepID=UPI001F5C4CB1|nr:hypothetical protein [Streptomyces sp. MST-110588]UNO39507.1 hypothetical protein KGS77_07700 [Streptomyces sp. MST-110588]